MRSSLLFAMVTLTTTVVAFFVPPTTTPQRQLAVSTTDMSGGGIVSLSAARKPTDGKTSAVNYGEIAGMFVNPLNPYSWFLYMFVGIIVLGQTQPQPPQ